MFTTKPRLEKEREIWKAKHLQIKQGLDQFRKARFPLEVEWAARNGIEFIVVARKDGNS